jgi:pimeloyl-ACP methyl ester carboxylesterase
MSRLSRRRLLQLVPGALLAPAAAVAGSAHRAGKTFVLVHGGFHGGWCWRKLAPLLRASGHAVFAPTLTGLGERVHCASADVDLDVHIKDVVSLLWFEDLRDVILVGHSYAGMVIAGAAHHPDATDRIGQLVYLDAAFPEDGRSLSDFGWVPRTRADGWRVPPLGSPNDTSRFGVTDPADLAWLNERLTDQPIRTLTQPVRLSSPRARALPGTYIQIGEGPANIDAAERAQQAGHGHVHMSGAGHDAMVTSPVELADILLNRLR